MKLFKLSSIKYLALILALIAALLLCSCGEDDAPAATEAPTEAPTDAPEVSDGRLVIFADGEYKCNIVRPENASKRELELYVNLREMLKEITGVMPPISTDFIAYNESYDPNKFEILVGLTNQAESAELYSKLTYSDFRAELINKKYAIAFHDMDTANSALEMLGSMLRSGFKNGEIVLDESWSYSLSEKEVLEDIPVYEGGKFSDVYEGAYGMQTIVIEKTSADEYENYLASLASLGYTPYTENTIGKNLFATYQSDKYILSAMFFDSRSEVRVTLEYSGNYDLPALEKENIYTDLGIESSITQIGLEESNDIQNGMSYVIKLADGSFIIFDGGTEDGMSQFYSVMESLAEDPNDITIAAWILTHAHGDHIGLIYSLILDEKFLENYTLEQIIWSKVGDKQLLNLGGGNQDYIDKLFARVEGARVVIAHPGQVFYIRNAVYTVLATIELVEPITLANLNDSSVVGRLEIDGRSFMFPGDSHPTETEAICSIYRTELKSDVVQVIHHGYQGGSAAFYAYVDPLTVFWPLGEFNYYQSNETPMKDWSYSAWLFSEDSKVETIHVAGSSVITIPIKDLPSHE